MESFVFGIFFLMMGGTFDVDNPPMPQEQAMMGVPDDCELFAYVDLRGIWDRAQEISTDFASRPFVASNTELAAMMSEFDEGIAMIDAMGPAMLGGVDPFRSVDAVSFCGRLDFAGREPLAEFVVIAQGSFGTGMDATLAALTEGEIAATTLPNGQTVYGDTEDGRIIGMVSPQEGVLVLGTESYLSDRASGALTATPPTSGTMMARAWEGMADGPQMLLGLQPSTTTRLMISSEAPVSIAQLVGGLEYAVYSSVGVGAELEVKAANASAHSNYELIVWGLGEYYRAAPHAIQAFANIALGAISPADPDIDAAVRTLVSHRDDILTFLGDYGVGGDPGVTFSSDAASFTSTLSIGDVRPLSAVSMGGMMVGMMIFMGSEPRYYDEPPMYEPYHEPTSP